MRSTEVELLLRWGVPEDVLSAPHPSSCPCGDHIGSAALAQLSMDAWERVRCSDHLRRAVGDLLDGLMGLGVGLEGSAVELLGYEGRHLGQQAERDGLAGALDLPEVRRRIDAALSEVALSVLDGHPALFLVEGDDGPLTHLVMLPGGRDLRAEPLGMAARMLSSRTRWILWRRWRTSVPGVLRVPAAVAETQALPSWSARADEVPGPVLEVMAQLYRDGDGAVPSLEMALGMAGALERDA